MQSEKRGSSSLRKYAYIFIVVSIALFIVSYSLSINVPPQQQENYSFPGGSLTITPSVLYVHNFLWYGPSAFVTVTLNHTESLVQVYVYQEYPTHLTVFSQTFHNASYLSFYFGLYPPSSSHVDKFLITINGEFVPVSLSIQATPYPMIGELSLLFSLVLFMIGVYLAPFRSRLWAIPIGLSFLILSAFLGHRYDMFFMISGGLHILTGVNPFIQSANLPGTLKWTYPPYYLVWSIVADWFAGTFSHTALPSTQSLIFSGVRTGNYYEAWLGFVPRSLPLYYLLTKLPMVASVFVTNYFLVRKFNLPYNTTKIWLLSPFVILIGVVWGQLDIIASAFLVISVYYFQKGRSDLAILASTLGFWIKIFPVFVLPFILIESRHRLRDSAIVVLSSIPALLMYALSGNFVKELEVMVYSRSVNTFNGVFSAQGLTWQVIISRLGVTQFPSIFLYLFIPFIVIITTVYYYKRGNVVKYLILEFLFFYLTYNYVDPQYLIVLVPLFLINRDLWNYAVFSIYPLAFTLLSYSFTYFVVPSLSVNYFSSPLGQQEALRTWITSSVIFAFPLVIAFTLSVVVTMWMTVTGRRFRFVENSIFAG